MIVRLLLIVVLFSLRLQAKEISVARGGMVGSIKHALELAKDGDVVVLKSGTYYERSLQIDKRIRVTGEHFPTIDCGRSGSILHIRAAGVVIEGIRFINTGISYTSDNAAVKVENADSALIRGNVFENNFFGIYVAGSTGTKVEGNRIRSNGKSESNTGNGIHLWKCRDAVIHGNRVEGHRDGIYLEFVEHSRIGDNLCTGNRRYGMHFMFSNNCVYERNTFSRNSAGVAVMFTRNVTMNGNTFEYNWGAGSYGILLKEIYNSTITNNHFLNNSVGIYCEGTNKTLIERNTFERNGWGIRLMANSMDNVFRGNDFVSNTFEVATNSTRNFNTFSGNYWSRYRGYDLNRDGAGDIPHHPVTLFSMLIEKNSTALLMLNSFLVDVLDMSEKVFPVLTPEALVDASPRMKRLM